MQFEINPFGSSQGYGCLPRESRVGAWFPNLGDAIQVIPRSQWPQHIGKIDLRPRVNKIKDQDGVGSCATEAIAQAVEMSRDIAGMDWVQLNPWFVYQTTSGGRDQGSTIDGNLRFVKENGIAPESVWPRSNGWRSTPSAEAKQTALKYKIEEAFDITTIEEFGTALLLGFPVEFGYSPGGGGHAVTATKLIDTNTFEFANSWGNWGDAGFGTLKLSQIVWGFGAFAVRVPTFSDEV